MTNYILLIWNVFTIMLYGIDKLKAKRRSWRISETALIVPAFMLGGVGALLGMVIFNHKTSKGKFRFLIPLAFILNIALVIYVYNYNI